MKMHDKYSSYTKYEIRRVASFIKDQWRKTDSFKSQTEFANEVLGVSQSAFSQLLNAARPIPARHVLKLCMHLGIPAKTYRKNLSRCPEYKRRFSEMVNYSDGVMRWVGENYE